MKYSKECKVWGAIGDDARAESIKHVSVERASAWGEELGVPQTRPVVGVDAQGRDVLGDLRPADCIVATKGKVLACVPVDLDADDVAELVTVEALKAGAKTATRYRDAELRISAESCAIPGGATYPMPAERAALFPRAKGIVGRQARAQDPEPSALLRLDASLLLTLARALGSDQVELRLDAREPSAHCIAVRPIAPQYGSVPREGARGLIMPITLEQKERGERVLDLLPQADRDRAARALRVLADLATALASNKAAAFYTIAREAFEALGLSGASVDGRAEEQALRALSVLVREGSDVAAPLAKVRELGLGASQDIDRSGCRVERCTCHDDGAWQPGAYDEGCRECGCTWSILSAIEAGNRANEAPAGKGGAA